MLYLVVFNDTATTEIYTYLHTLSLHDALPIYRSCRNTPSRRSTCARRHRGSSRRADRSGRAPAAAGWRPARCAAAAPPPPARGSPPAARSEEHTSELQSLMRISYAVFCLKKKNTKNGHHTTETRHKKNS